MLTFYWDVTDIRPARSRVRAVDLEWFKEDFQRRVHQEDFPDDKMFLGMLGGAVTANAYQGKPYTDAVAGVGFRLDNCVYVQVMAVRMSARKATMMGVWRNTFGVSPVLPRGKRSPHVEDIILATVKQKFFPLIEDEMLELAQGDISRTSPLHMIADRLIEANRPEMFDYIRARLAIGEGV